MRRGVVVGTAAAAVVVAAAWVGVSVASNSGSGNPAVAAAPTSTATVDRRDLVATTSVNGTLGYVDSRTLSARAMGTLTWLAAEGSVVQPGHRLYAVDDIPTVLLIGRVPAYRPLQVGSAGPDVRQLERGLRRLGYTGFTVDGTYTAATATAVKDWQGDLGVAKTGVVQLGAVVFAAGPLRVGAHAMEVGASVGPGAAVTAVSSTRRAVSVNLPVSDATYVKAGGHVTVTLPDGASVGGHVTSVGRVAQASTDAQGGSGEATIDVEIALSSGRVSALDEAPVAVDVETSRADHVLSVPVEALLALAEGGYGVQVVRGVTTDIVRVDPGLFANGRVEVTGDIAEGDRVVVPSS